jgi:hypothetical protein
MSRQYNNYGRDQINVESIQGNLVVHKQERLRNEQILLKAVRDEVETRLASSLHYAVFLNLGKEAQPDQVKRPWDSEIKIGAKAAQTIPDNTTITQIFGSPEIKGKLLILGQPGAGKTTTLLDLTEALVEQAEEDASYPIPVLFNLSSWKDEKQTIRDWAIAELKSKYGVSTKLGKQWIKERILLPLLDGLDEVAPERQEKCVLQINEFLAGEASPLYAVVCSRVGEYKNYETSLHLNGAVYLKELTDEKIQDYLMKVGRQDLWQSINQSSDLLAFVRAPLLLSMTVLAYPQNATEQWQPLQTAEDQLQHILDGYVERMLRRHMESRAYGKHNLPVDRQTRYWLKWLARQMERSFQTEFLIENMQSTWLQTPYQKFGYRIIFAIILGIILGLIFRFIAEPIFILFRDQYIIHFTSHFSILEFSKISIQDRLLDGIKDTFQRALFWGTLVTSILGFFLGINLGSKNIEPAESFELKKGSQKQLKKWALFGLGVGAVSSLLVGLSTTFFLKVYSPRLFIINLPGLHEKPIDVYPDLWLYNAGFWILFWVIFWLLFGLNRGLKADIKEKIFPNQGIWLSLRNSSILFLVFSLGLISLNFLVLNRLSRQGFTLSHIFINSLTTGALISVLVGGLASIQHFSLRLILFVRGNIPWNYARFLNYATERMLLQRVGGRYRFVHKLLEEYFAKKF